MPLTLNICTIFVVLVVVFFDQSEYAHKQGSVKAWRIRARSIKIIAKVIVLQ